MGGTFSIIKFYNLWKIINIPTSNNPLVKPTVHVHDKMTKQFFHSYHNSAILSCRRSCTGNLLCCRVKIHGGDVLGTPEMNTSALSRGLPYKGRVLHIRRGGGISERIVWIYTTQVMAILLFSSLVTLVAMV